MDEAMMARVQQFAERALGEAAATAGLALARVGDRLGLWQAMAGAGPLTPAELAVRTGTAERYVREWLACQAAGGYVTYNPAAGTFALPEEVAAVLAIQDSPAYGAYLLSLLGALWKDEEALAEAFRSGRRHRLAPAPPRPVRRERRARGPAAVPRPAPAVMDSRLGRRCRPAPAGRERGRRWLWVGGRHDLDGPGLPAVELRWLRYS